MKAARYYGPGDIRVEQVADPKIGTKQVKIKVAWNGICGSDLHSYLTEVALYASKDVPGTVTGETRPITLGHEFSGTIVEVGTEADRAKFKEGMKVVVEPVISCMKTDTCAACASGSRNLCKDMTFIGIGGWGGGLAEYINVNEEFVYVLPEGISLEAGALVEPLAVGWHAVNRSNFQEGNSALIVGAGPIGLVLLKVLLARKASKVFISEPSSKRREIAQKLGASYVIDPISQDAVKTVFSETANAGADVAYDCAGIQASIDACIRGVRPRGTVMNVALWEDDPALRANTVLVKEICYTGVVGYDRVHSDVLEALASGKITGLEELVTSKIALEDVVEKGFDALLKEKDTQIKILVRP